VKRILGIVGWLGAGLVLAAVVLRFAKPELQSWYQGLALAGLIVTALYALSEWRSIARSFSGKDTKYGSLAAGSVLIVLAILVAINWIGSRQNKRWDLTSNQQFSLSDQTRQILAGLKEPVTIRVFHGSGEMQRYRDQLAEFEYQSSQLSVHYVDADKSPVDARKYEITAVPTVLVEYQGRTERTSTTDEAGLTNALKKAIEGKAKKVYFTQGHGEHDPAGTDNQGYKGIADRLATDNFETAKVTIIQEGKIPDEATIVVVAGPTTDFFPPEVEALKAYLRRGGKLLLMLNPPDKGQAAQAASLVALAREWGVTVGDDIVVDASGLGQLIGTDASVPIGMPAPHAITSQFRVISAFPLARSITPVEGGVEGRLAQKVIETSPQSWAEADVKGLYETGRPARNLDKGDKAGPVTIAAAISQPAADAPAPPPGPDGKAATPDPSAPKPETRVVIVGDSDFAANRTLGVPGNPDLFLNMANWLAQQEDLIAIRPKDPEDRRITMTQDQSDRVFWLTLFIIPGLLFANGVRVWWKRR
jgi:ABC-type uncharacterized transport system involved in gliding motility auxiliary subunit